ncbi:MAG: hypothetical protein EOO77_08670 [Oxalobacteraceae bacterium]|nr:MAG: hypothetical protein EOO77_08670 [Oxalobacteraceae bacterium]
MLETQAVALPIAIGEAIIMQIKVMPDYDCAPLWWDGGERVGNINPQDLPLSEGLVEALWAWAGEYDATLNTDDPVRSGFDDDAAARDFNDRGRSLSDRLAGELEGATVRFWEPS